MIYAAKPDGAALEDKELLTRAVKLDLPIEPAHGDDVGKSVTGALALPPETVKMLNEILKTDKK